MSNVHDFKAQKRMSETPEIANLPYINYEDIKDIDSDNYDWHQIGNSKYGRYMYCPKTNIKRSQTMGEFYGTSTVD